MGTNLVPTMETFLVSIGEDMAKEDFQKVAEEMQARAASSQMLENGNTGLRRPSDAIDRVLARGPEGPHMSSPDIATSAHCAELFAALSLFQGEVTAAKKDSFNPHFKSKFADLAAVIEVARAPMAANGLALAQMPVGECNGFVRVVTLLTHKSGQWLKFTLDMPLIKKDPQTVGSAISYARRYCAMAALGIAADDDDGETAHGRGEQQPQQQRAPQQRQEPNRNPPSTQAKQEAPKQEQTPAGGSDAVREQRRSELLSLARTAGLKQVRDLSQFIFAALYNNEPRGLGDPFCSALTVDEMENVMKRLQARIGGGQ